MHIISFLAAAVMSLSAGFAVPESQAQAASAAERPKVSAKGSVVIDALSGDVLFAENESLQLPMASTTKIMSAYLALKLMQDELDQPFTVDSEAIKVEGSSMGLQQGDTVTLRALVCGMLLPSGNDAANAAAVRIAGSVPAFVELMNDCAAELGLTGTHFVTPSGLDDDTDDHYSTALDMARLTREALKLDSFRGICGSRTMQLEFGAPPYKRWLTNTNRLLGMCKGCIGVKTGFTDKAGRCLVSACERNGSTLICVTLNDKNDWADHQALYDYCFGLMQEVELAPELSGYKLSCPDKDVSLTAIGETGKISLPRSAVGRLQRVTLIKPIVYLPVPAGEQIGVTRFYLDGTMIASLPIRTAG